MDVNIRAIQNRNIDINMDSMSHQMSCADKLEVAVLLIKGGIADVLKSLDILRESNRENEDQLKLFRLKNSKGRKVIDVIGKV